MTKNTTVDYKKIMELGFTKSIAQQTIRQAKQKMVQQGYTIYSNRRLGSVPISAVEEILGFKLP
ncbi:DUF3173 family protein [Streptococcus vestibularis]|uniref:DUF3173 domain-containing protein n=1 Tax=Streptococcus vestibularis TaxID=1343 RepID=A0A564TN23_STRVE|nr:DUF3173 family protein [Streptococcus vestibularis]VUX08596.1 Uncharacterised protein [Streptococcus vestibularis]